LLHSLLVTDVAVDAGAHRHLGLVLLDRRALGSGWGLAAVIVMTGAESFGSIWTLNFGYVETVGIY